MSKRPGEHPKAHKADRVIQISHSTELKERLHADPSMYELAKGLEKLQRKFEKEVDKFSGKFAGISVDVECRFALWKE